MSKVKIYLSVLFAIVAVNILLCQDEETRRLENLEISVLTCGPGDQLYSIFGHTALYLKDLSRDLDIVYNWGTFDFNTPNFGIKFLRGKLPYALSISNLEPFLREYKIDKRWVEKQVITLSPKAKEELLKALGINLKEENRYYKYDFYFDNCTTRIRDILENTIGSVSYLPINDTSKTFRNLLHEHLDQHPWTKFGMDIILGTQSDQLASSREQMFLPVYFRDYLDVASSDNQKIVTNKIEILKFLQQDQNNSWWTPNRLFSVLLIVELLGFFMFYVSGDKGFLLWYDLLWFLALSIASLTFLFMWLCTDHTVCANNWNLLWAPPWILLAFIKNPKLRKICFLCTLFSNLILLVGWTYIPQQFHMAIILIALINIAKSVRLLDFKKWIDQFNKVVIIGFIGTLASVNLCGQDKIGGVTVVAPPHAFSSDPMAELIQVNANWVSLVPYGFSRPGQPEVFFGSERQWWGERIEGITECVKLARENGLKIMLKPQVWIPRGWVGEMDFDTEAEWKIWEDSYREYIMTFVQLAIEHEIEMLCVGTEYRICVHKRESYWRNLVRDIRKKYKGNLTYSSNWDAYDEVPIWDALDFIGISAYFPLSDLDTPPTLLLSYRWNKYIRRLKKLSEKHDKKILFTEFGYLSVNGAAGKTWELEKKITSLDINEQAQANGYEALLGSFWNKEFWAGGFLWKWFPEGAGHEGYPERDYTPQDKKAADVLSEWYGKR